ncbi:MAG: exo-alpha-sialidase [Thaumarchaeota archaeon]|nr:exo-alpha-sialidase [Nitrososphaerota archaeon]
MKGTKERTLLLVGTAKGAFVLSSEDSRRTWKVSGPHFKGNEIYHLSHDPRNGMIFASVNSNHWGPSVARSFDEGRTWKLSKTPPRFPKGSGLSVARVWHIEPGPEDEPKVIYAGVAPACLFRSDDGGASWSPNVAMMKHPTRKKWQPGAGGLCLHSVLVDERDSKKMHIAISAVGTMFTEDGGETWAFQNKHVLADFLPEKYPVFGQCVHKIARNSQRPNVIFQQNHCGVYRSDNGGEDWVDIRNNLPSRFGFPIAVDANDPRRVYVAPLEEDWSRIPPDGHFAVWASDNSGKEWERLDEGFPRVSYFTVLREGMTNDSEDPCGLYVGTTTGQLFASRDQGLHWKRITDGFPPILSVSVSRT